MLPREKMRSVMENPGQISTVLGRVVERVNAKEETRRPNL